MQQCPHCRQTHCVPMQQEPRRQNAAMQQWSNLPITIFGLFINLKLAKNVLSFSPFVAVYLYHFHHQAFVRFLSSSSAAAAVTAILSQAVKDCLIYNWCEGEQIIMVVYNCMEASSDTKWIPIQDAFFSLLFFYLSLTLWWLNAKEHLNFATTTKT